MFPSLDVPSLDDVVDLGLNALGVSTNSNSANNPYMTRAKQAATSFMSKEWLQEWQWAIEVQGAPSDFDIYAKDIDFGFGSIDVDTFQVGSGSIAQPTFSSAGEITLTVRDDQQNTMKNWFGEQIKKVKNKDGTLNLPKKYVIELKVFTLNDNGDKTLLCSYRVFAVKMGNLAFSREGVNQIHSFPIIFQKFSSVGSKVL